MYGLNGGRASPAEGSCRRQELRAKVFAHFHTGHPLAIAQDVFTLLEHLISCPSIEGFGGHGRVQFQAPHSPFARRAFEFLDQRRTNTSPARVRSDVTGPQFAEFEDSCSYADHAPLDLCDQTILLVGVCTHSLNRIVGHRQWRPSIDHR